MAKIKVEIAFLYDDHTWDTEIMELEAQEGESYDCAIARWFEEEGSKQAQYRKVVQVAPYHFFEEEADSDS